MTNELLQIKIKQRLNKLDSEDYDNLQCWQIQEAFNKAQREWTRRQIEGINQTRTGRESTSQRVADLQNLLTSWKKKFTKKGIYWESCEFPEDYLMFSKVSAKAKNDCCPPRPLVIYQGEESDVDIYLTDVNRKPSFQWAETFYTLFGNKIRIYSNDEFDIEDVNVSYYRRPRQVQIKNCTNTETGDLSTDDVTCEFRDGVIELIIDEAASILAYDLENILQAQRTQQNSEHNN